MIVDTAENIYKNVKDKLSNPFFATVVGVWIVRNWELVYTLFNFDPSYTLACKKAFIFNYYSDRLFWDEFLKTFGYSIFFFISGLALFILSKAIILFVQERIIPHTEKLVSSKLVIAKAKYDQVLNDRDLYFNKLNSERDTVVQTEKLNETLKNQLQISEETIVTLNKTIESKEVQSKTQIESNSKLESIIDTVNTEKMVVQLELDKYKNALAVMHVLAATKDIPYHISHKYFQLYLEDSAAVFFNKTAMWIENDESHPINPKFIEIFIALDLMNYRDPKAEDIYNTFNLELTEIGQQVYDNIETLYRSFKAVGQMMPD